MVINLLKSEVLDHFVNQQVIEEPASKLKIFIIIIIIVIIIYHDFIPTPRRGSHVKSDKTHTQSSRYNP